MNHENKQNAAVRPMKTLSNIWFIPLIALFIGCWMLYFQWSNEGPQITISFATAEGMEAGKTKIRSRSVDIGEVSEIRLNDNNDGVIVTAKMKKSAENLLVDDSMFWVVSPQISHTGVSGLNTLISGVYIEMSPGKREEPRLAFSALSSPPVTPVGTPGLHITLNSNDQFAYSKGDPVIYKGLTVGQFEDIYFNFDERIVYYNVFINAPYHRLITSHTKFWDVSGLSIDLNADGLTVNTGNLETMLTNGVTFGIPTGMTGGEQIGERSYFDIYANYEAADDERYRKSVHFVILVSDSIRGLKVGAPVEYRGVPIGKVASTNLMINNAPDKLLEQDFKIPVLIALQPGRVGLPDNDEGVRLMTEQNNYWIKNGLKAVLSNGNLLTGSLYIDLQHFKDNAVTEIAQFGEYSVIPTNGDEFTQITAKASKFIDNINAMPLDTLAQNGNELLLTITKTAQELQGVSQSLALLLNDANQQALSVELANTLKSLSTLSNDLSSGSKGYDDLRQTLKALTATMHELKPLLNQLKHQPNGLVFGIGETPELSPKKQPGAH